METTEITKAEIDLKKKRRYGELSSFCTKRQYYYPEEDIKEFIQKLKEENKKIIFEELESKRITDNSDYISIPIKEWFKIKENKKWKAYQYFYLELFLEW